MKVARLWQVKPENVDEDKNVLPDENVVGKEREAADPAHDERRAVQGARQRVELVPGLLIENNIQHEAHDFRDEVRRGKERVALGRQGLGLPHQRRKHGKSHEKNERNAVGRPLKEVELQAPEIKEHEHRHADVHDAKKQRGPAAQTHVQRNREFEIERIKPRGPGRAHDDARSRHVKKKSGREKRGGFRAR